MYSPYAGYPPPGAWYPPTAWHPSWYGAAPPAGPPPGWAAAATPMPAQAGLVNPRFIRGALIGAAVLYLLTNEDVQHAAIRGLVKARSLVQGGVEEMKERFRDAEAELHAAQSHEGG